MRIKSYLAIISLINLCSTTGVNASGTLEKHRNQILTPAIAKVEAERIFEAAKSDEKVYRIVIKMIAGQLLAEQDFINQLLPSEMVVAVFHWLPQTDLVACGKVNRRWRSLAHDNTLWKPIQAAIFAEVIYLDNCSDVNLLDSSELYTALVCSSDNERFFKLCSNKERILQQCNNWEVDGDFRRTYFDTPLGADDPPIRHIVRFFPILSTIIDSIEIRGYEHVKLIIVNYFPPREGVLNMTRGMLNLYNDLQKIRTRTASNQDFAGGQFCFPYIMPTETEQFVLALTVVIPRHCRLNALVLRTLAEQFDVHIDGF